MTRATTELAHLFRQLKAPAAAQALPKLADRARQEEWSYEQFAAVLLKTEGAEQSYNINTDRMNALPLNFGARGSGSVRTQERQRFAGDASVYGNAELRVPVAKFPLILPLSAAASGSAPAPSEMIRAFSAIMRIALRVSSRLTTNEPSTIGFILSHMRGKTLWPPAPSTNELFHSLNFCGNPAARESAIGAAVSGSTPQMLISGLSALSALPTPVMRPPPPMLAITFAVSGASSKISKPIVP